MNNLHKSWRESLAIFELKNLAISIAFCSGKKAALSFLTKRLRRDIFKTSKSGARVRCLSLPHNDFVS